MYIEEHPFLEFIPKNAKKLIVGSFPPIRITVNKNQKIVGENAIHYKNHLKDNEKKDINFYYGSDENSLWDLIAQAFALETPLDSDKKIMRFLEENSFGVTDIIEKCQRRVLTDKKTGKETIDSSDNSLKVLEYRDVIKSINENGIEKVYCTSIYVFKKLNRLDKNKTLKCILETLPSPSRQYSRSAWRDEEYKKRLEEGSVQNAIEYRLARYRELLQA